MNRKSIFTPLEYHQGFTVSTRSASEMQQRDTLGQANLLLLHFHSRYWSFRQTRCMYAFVMSDSKQQDQLLLVFQRPYS
jgi:hypothetical protein